MTALLDSLPILVIYLLIVLTSLGAAELGFRFGLFWNKRSGRTPGSAAGSLVGATLGLLAFILAITTGIAVGRFDNRRALVLAEANAIGTAYLRAGYLEEPAGTDSRDLLRDYLDVRLSAVDLESVEQAVQQSEEIQNDLWIIAETLAIAHPDSALLAIYIEALNNVFDIHASRVIAVETSRLPSTLWWEIFAMGSLIMFLAGANNSVDGERHLLSMVILALVFGAVILLIVDLDRPQGGFLRVSQQALIELQQQLNAPAP